MLVLPLAGPLGTGGKPTKEPKVMFQPLKWDKEGQRPVRWQACSPLLIPENAALVLEEGDIKFVILQVVTKLETVGKSQTVAGGE